MYIKYLVSTLCSNTRKAIFKALALSSFVVAGTLVSHAQARMYVATNGNDINPCTVALPCRTFQVGHDNANPGGEVVALDTGTFGKRVTITKGITIAAAPGVHAGLTPPAGQAGVTVIAGATHVVVLRNLYLDGHKTAPRGIDFQSGAELHVEHCVVSNFTGEGIYLGGLGRAFISDTTVRNNDQGMVVSNGFVNTPTDSASINRCRAEGNSSKGFYIVTTKATFRDSVATGNGTGFYCHTGVMNITGSMATNNQIGVFIESITSYVGTARIAYSTVTGNERGLYNNGVFVNFYSLGNNLVHGNGQNVVGMITVIPGT